MTGSEAPPHSRLFFTGTRGRALLGARFFLGWLLVCLGLAASVPSLLWRWRHEQHPAPVQMTLEWSDTRACADAWGRPHAQLLRELRRAGARAVMLDMETVGSLRDEGRLTLLPRSDSTAWFPQLKSLPDEYTQIILCSDAALRSQIQSWLTMQEKQQPPIPAGPEALAVALSQRAQADWPVGLDPLQVREVQAVGLTPVVRLGNPVNLTPRLIDQMLDAVRASGARTVCFEQEALGQASLLEASAAALRARGLSVLSLEGASTRGLDDILKRSNGLVVRGHAVGVIDTQRAPAGEVIDRYVRAARERNVNFLLVRLARPLKGDGAATAVAQNLDFVRRIGREVTADPKPWRGLRPALRLGVTHPAGDYPSAALGARFGSGRVRPILILARLGAGLGALGAMWLLLNLLCDPAPRKRLLLFSTGLLLTAGLSLSSNTGAKLLALLAASAFPVVAVLWGGAANVLAEGLPRERRPAAGVVIRTLLRTAAISTAGGFVIAALLNDWRYWTHVEEFAGTKFAGVFPLVLLTIAFAGEFWPERVQAESACPAWERAKTRLRTWLDQSYTLLWAGVSFAALLTVVIWLARSGNDSGLAVSPLEWKFRALLEQVFVARPRTKEFLLCHPAFLLALLCAGTGKRRWAVPLLLLGTIGQTGIVNSFAQTNNPLYIPIWRTILGVLLALGPGLALWWYLAPRLGYATASALLPAWYRKAALGGAAAGLLFWSWMKWDQRRRYAELTTIGPDVAWPWREAKSETLRPGVRHWETQAADGTTQDLLEFDFKDNPRLHLSLWDQDVRRGQAGGNRMPYWERGIGQVGRTLNKNQNLVAAWNGAFFGLTNQKPREADRAFHLSPVVVNGQALYPGLNHRWTWGVKYVHDRPVFKMLHQPGAARLAREFDFATGTFQALVQNGRPLRLRPYPYFGESVATPPVPSTPAEAGHIPTLDHMRTSRCGVGWTADGKLFVLFVKEPDGETLSRAQFAARKPATGGWSLAEHQQFWLSLRQAFPVQNAAALDGGDVAQLLYRKSQRDFEVRPPRLALESGPGTVKLETDSRFSNLFPIHGGALNYFVIQEWSQTRIALTKLH